MHSRQAFAVAASLLVAILVVGCSSTPERELSRVPARYATLPNGHDPLNPEQITPLYAELRAAGGNLVRGLERVNGRPLEILSLSGGGQNGAFGAGFLVGWRESGRRPRFDAVSGVSTGALLATHALLGTPEDDVALERMYTEVERKDIYKQRSVFGLLSGTDSLMDTAPLRQLIADYITEETLARVAAAADERRLLFVGTTNIDYEQTWVWNMSLIAKDGDLELYRDVLLASASFPIVFPPVEIDGHLFVDGAVRSNLVVAGLAGETPPGPPLHGPGNLYLIDNGKQENPPEALRRALGDVAAMTLSAMMTQSMQTALTRTYVGARALGYNFKLVSIEPHVEIGKDSLAFDPDEMRAAFDAGRALARQEDPWQPRPSRSNDLPVWADELIRIP
ncbi:MAG: patatin-like phospholipase family protein [Planctomycetota bacterium]